MIKLSVAVLTYDESSDRRARKCRTPEKNDGLLIDLDTSFTDVLAFKAIANLSHKLPIRS
jgi:hypothetical protein